MVEDTSLVAGNMLRLRTASSTAAHNIRRGQCLNGSPWMVAPLMHSLIVQIECLASGTINNVRLDGVECMAKASEFLVGLYVNDVETPGFV